MASGVVGSRVCPVMEAQQRRGSSACGEVGGYKTCGDECGRRMRMRDAHCAIKRRDRAAANAVESICKFDSLVSEAATEARSRRWAAALARTGRHRRDDRERPA